MTTRSRLRYAARVRRPHPAPPPDLRVHPLQHGARRFIVMSYSTLPVRRLSAAEREVLTAVLAGRSNAQIAAQRNTQPRTIANQIARAFAKLGVRSRAELVAYCARRDELP
jgi:DNA-binding CsgD family transcriptional regulator